MLTSTMRTCLRTSIWQVLCAAVLLLGICIASAIAAEPKFPALTGRVVDEAGLLTASEQARITGWLENFEQTTKRQVVVVTVKSLQGYPIEDFGYRLGRAWGIGEKDRNTGAILVVAPNEREVRIEVGYGLEGELTDAISRAIIEQNILPGFRAGNYGQGIVNGTAAILQALGWDGAVPEASLNRSDVSDELPPLAIFILILLFMFFRFFGGGGFGGFGGRRGGGIWGASSRGGFSGRGGSFGGGGASGRW